MPTFDILCVGEVNVDLILAGIERLPRFGEEVLASSLGMHLGGCTANVAIFAARLGLRTALRARVGADEFGQFLIAELQRLGVCTDHILRDDSLRTGLTVSLSGPDDRAFVTYVGTIDSLTAADVSDDLLASARHLHVGSYFLQRRLQPDLAVLFRRAQALGLTTSLDTGYDPYEDWDAGLSEVLPAVDLFMPNEVEARAITCTEDPVEGAKFLARSAGRVALKLGACGAMLIQGDQVLRQPAYPVQVVDTTCCGDAFNAGLLAAMLDGRGPQEQLRWGAAAGAIVAGGSGNSAERLSRQAVQELASTTA